MKEILFQRNFELVAANDEEAMGKLSSDELIELLNYYTVRKKVPVVLNLAAAPSQDASYRFVVMDENKGKINWDLVYIIHLDEYFDLPNGHPNTFKSYLEDHFISRLNSEIPKTNIHFIKDYQKDCSIDELIELYSDVVRNNVQMVREKGGAYIAHIGIGVNGHMGFNEPHIDKHIPKWVIPVELDQISIRQQFEDYRNHPNPLARYNSMSNVPKIAVTISMAGILDADHIICVVPGEHKADAVFKSVYGPIHDKLPGSMSRLSRDFRLFLDAKSSSLMYQSSLLGNSR
jgi:glucosamine-6-phosphate deaminase